MTPATVLTRNPALIAAEMDGELVMMDVEQGAYFNLNAVGSHIWEGLENPTSVQDLVASIKEAFDTDAGTSVEADTLGFLQTLLDKGLVHQVDG